MRMVRICAAILRAIGVKQGSLLRVEPSVKDRNVPSRYLNREIGKYRVIRFLGGGAFAWVYEAIDRDLEIPVALKILRPEFSGHPEAEARFRREAATAARLRHPNIVNVRDVGQFEGTSFVAMDLLPLSLARRLEVLPRIPEADVVLIGLEVAAALAVAHAGGIVHRDIKPDNILIGTRGEAIVADFGLARALENGAATSVGNAVMGTPHYFSPEQARGLEVDGRSDLYALGVTLFRSATGRLPFEGDDWYAVARMHVEAPAPSVRDLVPELTTAFDRIIARLLSKAPADRFANAVELADAFAALPTAPLAQRRVRSPSSDTSIGTPGGTSGGSTSDTVAAFPPVLTTPKAETLHDAGSTRRVPRWLSPTLLVGVIALSAWALAQWPALRSAVGLGAPTDGLNAGVATGPRGAGEALPAPGDSSALATPTIPVAVPQSAADKRPIDLVRRQATAAVRSRLTITADDSANLYVDDSLVGRGSAEIERPSAALLSVRAVIADAPVNCASAQRDSVVRLAVGERRSVNLSVRFCASVRLTIVPADARVRFESLDGGTSIERIDLSAGKMLLVPVGKYEIKASAPGCFPYQGDILELSRRDATKIVSRSIKMTCT